MRKNTVVFISVKQRMVDIVLTGTPISHKEELNVNTVNAIRKSEYNDFTKLLGGVIEGNFLKKNK